MFKKYMLLPRLYCLTKKYLYFHFRIFKISFYSLNILKYTPGKNNISIVNYFKTNKATSATMPIT